VTSGDATFAPPATLDLGDFTMRAWTPWVVDGKVQGLPLRGLATRAAAALTHVAFADPSIDHVEIRCDPRNAASGRVSERLGYRKVEPPPDAIDLQVRRLGRADAR